MPRRIAARVVRRLLRLARKVEIVVGRGARCVGWCRPTGTGRKTTTQRVVPAVTAGPSRTRYAAPPPPPTSFPAWSADRASRRVVVVLRCLQTAACAKGRGGRQKVQLTCTVRERWAALVHVWWVLVNLFKKNSPNCIFMAITTAYK